MPEDNPGKPAESAPDQETTLTNEQLDEVAGGANPGPKPPPVPGRRGLPGDPPIG